MTKVDTAGPQNDTNQLKINLINDDCQQVGNASDISSHSNANGLRLSDEDVSAGKIISRSITRMYPYEKVLEGSVSSHLLIRRPESYSSVSTVSSEEEVGDEGFSSGGQGHTNTRSDNTRAKKLRGWAASTFQILREPFQDTAGSFDSLTRGLFYLSIVGIILGLAMPKNQDLPSPLYRYASSVIGYTYSTFWCVSFYPQLILNFQRKSTEGISVDFAVVNFIGFVCYAIYTCCFYWSKDVNEMYQDHHNHATGIGGDILDSTMDGNGESNLDDLSPDANVTVQSNDVAFAIHSVILSTVWLIQLILYGGPKKENRESTDGLCSLYAYLPISFPFIVLILVILSSISIYAILVILETTAQTGGLISRYFPYLPRSIRVYVNWLDFLYFLSLVKMVVTVMKYIPQVALNARRKSCSGWNIWNVVLDFSGGWLSLLQLVGDAIALEDFSSITGNAPKLGLSLISMAFDIVFFLQHYVCFRDTDRKTNHELELIL